MDQEMPVNIYKHMMNKKIKYYEQMMKPHKSRKVEYLQI